MNCFSCGYQPISTNIYFGRVLFHWSTRRLPNRKTQALSAWPIGAGVAVPGRRGSFWPRPPGWEASWRPRSAGSWSWVCTFFRGESMRKSTKNWLRIDGWSWFSLGSWNGGNPEICPKTTDFRETSLLLKWHWDDMIWFIHILALVQERGMDPRRYGNLNRHI